MGLEVERGPVGIRAAYGLTAPRRPGRLCRNPKRREESVSTGLIIAIVVIALILIGLLVLLPRMREKARDREARA